MRVRIKTNKKMTSFPIQRETSLSFLLENLRSTWASRDYLVVSVWRRWISRTVKVNGLVEFNDNFKPHVKPTSAPPVLSSARASEPPSRFLIQTGFLLYYVLIYHGRIRTRKVLHTIKGSFLHTHSRSCFVCSLSMTEKSLFRLLLSRQNPIHWL